MTGRTGNLLLLDGGASFDTGRATPPHRRHNRTTHDIGPDLPSGPTPHTVFSVSEESNREKQGLDPPTPVGVLFGPFRLVETARLLERDARPVEIGSRAFDILALLLERCGTVVSKRDLMARGWPDLTVDETSLRVQITGLRKVLGDGVDGARYIANLPGRGYCFVAPVRVEQPAPSPEFQFPQATSGQDRARQARHIVGREDVVRRIEFFLHTYRFVTIHGPGGMGKTTVAKAVVAATSGAFESNVVFLDIGAITDPALLASALASALGLMVHDENLQPQIIGMLRERRALIVFDSCEHAIRQVAELAEAIHREAPGVSLLVTSREPLRVAGERVVQLAALALPPRDRGLAMSQVMQFSAAELFAERAFAAGLPADLTEADIATLVEICHALDGIPLAIEIAASRSGRHGLAETAQLLDGTFRLLWQGQRSAVARHQTLHATLDWSYNLLSQEEQSALQWLSVFASRFSRDAAAAIALTEPEHAHRVLDDLVAKSMVSIEFENRTARYRLLDTTRAYAAPRLQATEDEATIRLRHLQHVSGALSRVQTSEQPGQPPDPVSYIDLLAELRAALAWSFGHAGHENAALQLVARATPFFFKLQLFDESCRWLERALALIDSNGRDGAEEMQIEGAYGMALMLTQANSIRAQLAFERATDTAERLEDWETAFQLNVQRQILHRRIGEYNRIHPLTDKAEFYADQLDDHGARASARLLRGAAHAICGNQIQAELILREAWQHQQVHPISPQQFSYAGDAQIPLSLTLWLRGFPDQAAQAARNISEDSGDVLFTCLARSWAATVMHTMGEGLAALQLAAKVRHAADRHVLRPYQAVATGFEAESLLQKGDVADAVQAFQNAVLQLKDARYGLYESVFSRSLTIALLEAGDVFAAEQVVLDHLVRIEGIGCSYDHAEWLRMKALVELQSGRRNASETTLRRSIALATEQGAMAWALRSATSLARLLMAQDGYKHAATELTPIFSSYTEGFATQDLILANELLAELGPRR